MSRQMPVIIPPEFIAKILDYLKTLLVGVFSVLGFIIIGFVVGLFIEYVPYLSVMVDDGFYYAFGVNTQTRFREIGAMIGFLMGFVTLYLRPILTNRPPIIVEQTLLSTQQSKPLQEFTPSNLDKRPPIHTELNLSGTSPPTDEEDLARHLTTVSPQIEEQLISIRIFDLTDLANTDVKKLIPIVSSKRLAQNMIEEAKAKLQQIRGV